MKESTKLQYARVEQVYGYEAPKAHCPICGFQNNADDCLGVDPCPHLAFMYGFDCSEFAYKSDDFDLRTSMLDVEDISFTNIEDFLFSAGYRNNMLAIEITYGGGLSWATDLYGYDYAIPLSDSDDEC